VVIRVINAADVSSTRRDAQGCHASRFTAKVEGSQALHGVGVPDMDGRLLSDLTSGDDVALALANRQVCNIILMHRPVVFILLLHLFFFKPSKKLLLVRGDVLDDSDSSGHEQDLIVIFSKIEARFLPIS